MVLRSVWLPLIALGAFMSIDTAAQIAPQFNISQAGTLLTVQTSAEVKTPPDIASISSGVMTIAPTGKEAMTQNAVRMAAMMASLKTSGIADKDIQTSGITLQPQYFYGSNNEPPKLTGYQAQNIINVTVRKLDNLGNVIDAMASKGATNLNGPNFTVDNTEPLLDQARERAVQKAIKRAELYARAASLRVKRIVSIQEGSGQQPQPIVQQTTAFAEAKIADTPIAIGRVELSVAVTMTFELEK
jgi:uncharacterized protein